MTNKNPKPSKGQIPPAIFGVSDPPKPETRLTWEAGRCCTEQNLVTSPKVARFSKCDPSSEVRNLLLSKGAIMSNQTLIDKIRAAFPIAPFVASYTGGLKDTRNGFFTGRCPFHQSPTDRPNKRKFWVDARPGRQICGCFVPDCPAHQPPMDVINFYARIRGISNREAIHELSKKLPGEPTDRRK